MVPALGLGEITLHSALNQPFEAEIELFEVGDLSSQDLRVSLAPAEVFSRSGVERLYFLNDLRFTPLLRGTRSVIRVVSSRPVREPYLNFIVEVARPGGQLLREYTVLLDPPGSAAYTALSAPAAALPRNAAAPVPARTVTPPSAALGHRHQVVRGDSLWLIAARLREQGSSLSQQALMDGIFALNPQAFAAGDPARLQAGAELLLPDAARPSSVAPASSAAPAVADAPAAAVEPVSASPVAPEPAPAPEATQSLQQVLDKQRQVDLELANQAEENLQLQEGLAQLQSQVQQLQEQLQRKDAQLAELTAQAAGGPAKQLPAVSPATPEPVAERGWLAMLLPGAVASLLLLGALLWAARRRRKGEPVLPVEAAVGPPIQQTPAQPVAEVQPALAAVPVARPAAVAVPRAPGPVDPLEAANVYIAYGRLSEARGELDKALARDPQRSDLRFRLMEVLAQLGDGEAFRREEAVLSGEDVDPGRIEALKAKHPELQALRPVPREPLPAAAAPLPVQAETLAEPDFQLNLDDLPLDADWDLVSPFPAARAKSKVVADPEPEFDASFASNLQELPEVFELHHDSEHFSAFGEMEMVLLDEQAKPDMDFLDAFAGDADATAALQGDIDQLAGNPEHMTQLNQALAYIKQGDLATACDILNAVIDQGDDQQKQAARQLLAEIA